MQPGRSVFTFPERRFEFRRRPEGRPERDLLRRLREQRKHHHAQRADGSTHLHRQKHWKQIGKFNSFFLN